VNNATPASPKSEPEAISADSWYIVGLMMLAFTFSHMDRNVMSILLNSIKYDLGLTDFQAGLMHGPAFAFFYVVFGLPIARAADKYNRVNIIAAALTVWSAMTALCGMAQNFTQLALARMGVGVGEAGCVPPAQSIIADLVPPQRRAFALSVFSIGAPLGTLLGIVAGGVLESWFDWRTAFLAIGLPGVLVGLLIKFTVKEPVRGKADGVAPPDHVAPKVIEVLSTIWHLKSLKHMIIGSSLIVFGGYGASAWLPSFLERSHDLSTFQVSLMLGPVMLIGGVGGLIVSGRLTDRLIRRNVEWYARVPAIATILAVPISAIVLMIPKTTYVVFGMDLPSYAVAISLFALPGAAFISYMGPVNAMMQNMVGLRMRAMTVAVFLFVTNLIGMGLGPPLIGLTSDYMEAQYGDESLRMAMLSALFVYVWAAFHFNRARRTLAADLAKHHL